MGDGGSSKEDLLISYFHEVPITAPAYAAIVVFAVVGLIALLITIRTRAWFMLVVPITAWLEVLGFGFRLQTIHSPAQGSYIGMMAILIIVPVLLPLINYLVVGKLMALSQQQQQQRGEQGQQTPQEQQQKQQQQQPGEADQAGPVKLPLKPKWVARIFTTSDFLCLTIQGAGGGMIVSPNPTTAKNGRNLILVGLFVQLGFFTAFTWLLLWVHAKKDRLGLTTLIPKLNRVLFALYSTIVLLYIRNIFRVIEFVMGYDSYVATHEEYFWVFDFAMICSCCILYTVFHFGWYLPKSAGRGTAVSPAPSVSGIELSPDSNGNKIVVKPSPRAQAQPGGLDMV